MHLGADSKAGTWQRTGSTFSIANSIAIALITHGLILMLTGKAREIKPLTVIVSLIFVARYAFITLG